MAKAGRSDNRLVVRGQQFTQIDLEMAEHVFFQPVSNRP